MSALEPDIASKLAVIQKNTVKPRTPMYSPAYATVIQGGIVYQDLSTDVEVFYDSPVGGSVINITDAQENAGRVIIEQGFAPPPIELNLTFTAGGDTSLLYTGDLFAGNRYTKMAVDITVDNAGTMDPSDSVVCRGVMDVNRTIISKNLSFYRIANGGGGSTSNPTVIQQLAAHSYGIFPEAMAFREFQFAKGGTANVEPLTVTVVIS